MQHERPGVDPEKKERPHRTGDRGGPNDTMQQQATPPLYTPKRQNSRRRNTKQQDRRESYRWQGKPGGSELLKAVQAKLAAAREGSR